MNQLEQYAYQLGQLLQTRNWHLVTAESCTGGWIAQTMTSVAGSSAWFDCGFVSYSNASKQTLLDVEADTLIQYGAVSQQTVLAMVKGAITHSQAQVGIAISGIAGPEGGTADKPVGTVWIAYALPGLINAQSYYFAGNRHRIRELSVETSLKHLISII